MKRLNKLQINPEKVMKNEEMITIAGGVNCYCFDKNNNVCQAGTAGSEAECRYMCLYACGY